MKIKGSGSRIRQDQGHDYRQMSDGPGIQRPGPFAAGGPIPDDVVRRAADGDDVGRAVAVEVAAAEVLGGDRGPGRCGSRPCRRSRRPRRGRRSRGGRRRPRRRRRRPRRRPRGRGRRRGSSSITVRGPNSQRPGPSDEVGSATSLPCQGSMVARNRGRRRAGRRGPRSHPAWAPRRHRRSSGRDQPADRRDFAPNQVTPQLAAQDVRAAVAVEIEHVDRVQDGPLADDPGLPAASPSGRSPGRKTTTCAGSWSNAGRLRRRARRSGPRPGRAACRRRRPPSGAGGCSPRRRSASASRGRRTRPPATPGGACPGSARSSRTRRRWRSRPCRRRRGRPSRC